VETPKLIIDRDIASYDVYAEMWGDPQPVFSANTLTEFLDQHKDATSIEVDIMSAGGSTSEARIIYDLLKNCGKTVITRGFKVNSSAVMIFLAGDERLIAENADFVIHPVWIDAMGLPWMLTGEDLQDFANEIKAEETKLIDLYVSVIGENKRAEVTELMKASTNLSNEKAIELGFATGKLGAKAEKTENKRAVSFNNKMAALVLKNKSNLNQKEMSLLTETLNKINETLSKFKNSDEEETTQTLNASVELSEGGAVYFDGELAEGVMVFVDESMETKAPVGDHLLADGRVITVDEEGMVTAIAAASAEETEAEDKGSPDAENKEVEELKNTVSTLTETVNAQAESINKIAETLKNMTPAFAALQNLVPGDTGGESTLRNKKRKVEEVTPAEYAKMTNLEKKRYNQSRL
jgi:ATP-dependent protease ClpP protease subunit